MYKNRNILQDLTSNCKG